MAISKQSAGRSKVYIPYRNILEKYIKAGKGRFLLNTSDSEFLSELKSKGIGYPNFFAHTSGRKVAIEIAVLAYEEGRISSGKDQQKRTPERSGVEKFDVFWKIMERYVKAGKGWNLVNKDNSEFKQELLSKGIGDEAFFRHIPERRATIEVAVLAYEAGAR